MKNYTVTLLIASLILPLSGKANISWGEEWENCFKNEKVPPLGYKCLSDKKETSEKQLDLLIAKSVKSIKINFIGVFNGKEDATETYGDVYSIRFLKSQDTWKQYRKEFCLAAASQINEDAYDYQANIDQCEINLNRRHKEEINLLGLPRVVE